LGIWQFRSDPNFRQSDLPVAVKPEPLKQLLFFIVSRGILAEKVALSDGYLV